MLELDWWQEPSNNALTRGLVIWQLTSYLRCQCVLNPNGYSALQGGRYQVKISVVGHQLYEIWSN